MDNIYDQKLESLLLKNDKLFWQIFNKISEILKNVDSEI